MTQQTSPFIEGKYGWNFGESGWNSGMDENLLKFSYLLDGNITGIVSSLPAAINGNSYFLTTDLRIYYVVNNTYYSTPTPKWMVFTVKDSGVPYQFNGTNMIEVPTNTALGSRVSALETTTASLGTAAFVNVSTLATQSDLAANATASTTYADTKVAKVDLASQTDNSKGSALIGYKNRTQFAKNTDVVSVEDFSTATNPLIAALASLSGGGRLLVNGTYNAPSINVPAGVQIYGSGVIYLTGTSGDLITLNANSTITGLSLTHATDPTGTVMVRLASNKAGLYRCQLTNYFVGVAVGTTANIVITPEIIDCNFFSPKVGSGSGGIWLINYGNAIVKDNVLSGPDYPAVQPDYGLRIHNGDTAFITDNNITHHGFALYMDVPAGLNNYALRGSGNLFDSPRTITGQTIVHAALIIPAGNIYDALLTNTWFGLSVNGSGLHLSTTGTGNVDGFSLDNSQAIGNAIAGIYLGSTRLKNIKISTGYCSANATYGVGVAAGVTDFELVGVKTSNVGGRGGNGRGINVDTGASNNYIITGCSSRGNTVFNFFDGGSGTNKVVANNLTT